MTLKEKIEKLNELKSQKRMIDELAKPLETEVLAAMREIGTKKIEIDGGPKAAIVETETLRVVDEKKVVKKLKALKLDKEYVEPRLKDIFNVKEFVAQQGMIEGIETRVSEYLKITPYKEEVAPIVQ